MLDTTDRGDVRELLDASGASFAFYAYDAYGNPDAARSASGTSALVPSATVAAAIAARQPLRYASYAFDSESGLYYCSARYYDPATFAFISRDPIKADAEESLYQYCGGNPVNQSDPAGTDPPGKGVNNKDSAEHKNWVDNRHRLWHSDEWVNWRKHPGTESYRQHKNAESFSKRSARSNKKTSRTAKPRLPRAFQPTPPTADTLAVGGVGVALDVASIYPPAALPCFVVGGIVDATYTTAFIVPRHWRRSKVPVIHQLGRALKNEPETTGMDVTLGYAGALPWASTTEMVGYGVMTHLDHKGYGVFYKGE